MSAPVRLADLRDPGVRQALLQRFAPRMLVHPRERALPMDPAAAFARARVRGDNLDLRTDDCGADAWGPDEEKLAAELYAQVDETNGTRLLRVPVSAQLTAYRDEFIRINYWFFYPWNGHQCFTLANSVQHARRIVFEVGPLAYHEGDWEHISVVLNKEGTEIDMIGATAHGEQEIVRLDAEMRRRHLFGRHPVVHVALNTHASYLDSRTVVMGDRRSRRLIHWLSPLLFWTWRLYTRLDVVDVVALPRPEETFLAGATDRGEAADARYIRWDTWEQPIADLSDPGALPEWARFKGPWGLPLAARVADPVRYTVPRALPGRRRLSWILAYAARHNLFDAHYLHFNPAGPTAQIGIEDLAPLAKLRLELEPAEVARIPCADESDQQKKEHERKGGPHVIPDDGGQPEEVHESNGGRHVIPDDGDQPEEVHERKGSRHVIPDLLSAARVDFGVVSDEHL